MLFKLAISKSISSTVHLSPKELLVTKPNHSTAVKISDFGINYTSRDKLWLRAIPLDDCICLIL